MTSMPFQILGLWLRPLVSLALLGIGIYLVVGWVNTRQSRPEASNPVPMQGHADHVDPVPDVPSPARTATHDNPVDRRGSRAQIGFNAATAALVGGCALILWSIAGGWLSSVPFLARDANSPEEASRLVGAIERLRRPDGTELHVEVFGSPEGIPIVLTHGWGLDSKEWVYARKELANRCKIIVWDLPGLGRSKGPVNNDWSLEKLANDLDAVMIFAGSRPMILAGHSIGGMIILTYCRLFQHSLPSRVAGVVLGQTTYTNPVETTSMAAIYRAIQKPVLEPLCYLMIGLAPLVWLMNWWSYLTGSVHRTNHKSFFSGQESREQLGFVSRYSVQAWPAVIARGFLAMFHFDATPTLGTIVVPTLIVGGERDITCKPEASKLMSESIPNAYLVTLKTARHGGVFEFHQQFAEAIHQFMSTSLAEDAANEPKNLPSGGKIATRI